MKLSVKMVANQSLEYFFKITFIAGNKMANEDA